MHFGSRVAARDQASLVLLVVAETSCYIPDAWEAGKSKNVSP